jgi:hypothetical protein
LVAAFGEDWFWLAVWPNNVVARRNVGNRRRFFRQRPNCDTPFSLE